MTRYSTHIGWKLRMIGAGSCGTIWSAERGPAYKRGDGGPFRSLENDYNMHRRVLDSMREFHSQSPDETNPHIQIPDCEGFFQANDDIWLQAFPPGYTLCQVLQSQRIPPFPEMTRRLLVEEYCPPHIADDILASEANKDCLIRPYLGRRRARTEPRRPIQLRGFSLRNLPLHVDQMDDLGISLEDRQQYARIMARTLAIIHWYAKIDGADIEFVLAPPNRTQRRAADVMSSVLGDHSMWVLDFDCCRYLSPDHAGVEQAVSAFWRNDPFYPRPIIEPALWAAFRVEYLQVSEASLRLLGKAEVENRRGFPQLFIDKVEDIAQSRYGNTVSFAEY